MKNLKNQLHKINGECYYWIIDFLKAHQANINGQSSVILYNIIQTFFAGQNNEMIIPVLEGKLKSLELADLENLSAIQCLKISSNQLFDENPLNDFFISLKQDFELTAHTAYSEAERRDLFTMDEQEKDDVIAEIIESAHLSFDVLHVPLLKNLSALDVLYLQAAMLEAYEKYDLLSGNSLLRTLSYLGKADLAADAAVNYLLAQQNVIGYFGQTLNDQDLESSAAILTFLELQFDCLWSLNEAGNQDFSLMELIRQEDGYIL